MREKKPIILHSLACAVGIVVAVLVLSGCASQTREPANLDRDKAVVRRYVESGQYQRDIARVAEAARGWMEQRTAHRVAGERLAIVFDLDETLLSNWPFIDSEDFGGSDAAWDTWMAAGNDPAIESVRDLYRAACRLGVDVIFISARHEHLRASTEKNLRAIDCGTYARLILTADTSKETASQYKAAQRQRLIAEGRVIIANVGDQDSDLAGGYAERGFKLPDPFYLTP